MINNTNLFILRSKYNTLSIAPFMCWRIIFDIRSIYCCTLGFCVNALIPFITKQINYSSTTKCHWRNFIVNQSIYAYILYNCIAKNTCACSVLGRSICLSSFVYVWHGGDLDYLLLHIPGRALLGSISLYCGDLFTGYCTLLFLLIFPLVGGRSASTDDKIYA